MNKISASSLHLGLAIGVVVVVITAGTLYQAERTGRWHDLTDTEELAGMAERMKEIPLKFGEWEGTPIPTNEIMAEQYQAAKVRDHADILFRHRRNSNKEVTVSLVCAPHRSISRHTPDKCFVGAGYDIADQERREVVSTAAGDVECRTAQFIRLEPSSRQNQRIVWCFADATSGKWIAPDSGRFGLSGAQAWYKLYVTTSIAGTKRSADLEESQEFLRDFIPALNKALFPERTTADDGT